MLETLILSQHANMKTLRSTFPIANKIIDIDYLSIQF